MKHNQIDLGGTSVSVQAFSSTSSPFNIQINGAVGGGFSTSPGIKN